MEAAIIETKCELRAALLPNTEGGAPAESVLDHALASLEHLNEIAEVMMRQLDELVGA